MQPPKDFTNKVDTLSSVPKCVTNISSSGLESHHLHHHETDEEDAEPRRGAQDAHCQITLGPDAGILEVPNEAYVCINDSVRHGGVCTSGEKVYQARAKCSHCIANKRVLLA